MNAAQLIAEFGAVAEAPGGVERLRGLALDLAIRGRLVEQNSVDEPFSLDDDASIRGQPGLPDPLPFQWKARTLGSLGVVIGGGTPSKRNPLFWDGEIPWVSPKDMKRPRIGDSIDHVTPEAIANSSAKHIPPESLLMVVRGMILAKNFPVALTTASVTINQDMKALVPQDPEISEFLLLVLQAHRQRVMNLVETSTHGTCRLSTDKLLAVPVPLPPLGEQIRIVARVDELMALCDHLEEKQMRRRQVSIDLPASLYQPVTEASSDAERRSAWVRVRKHFDDLTASPDQIPALRQAILELAVRGRLVKQEPEDEHGMLLEEDPSLEEPHELPRSWGWSRLGQLVTEMGAGWSPRCSPAPTDSEAEWGILKTTAVQSLSFKQQHHKKLPSRLVPRPHLEVQAGDLLVTRAGPTFRVGICCFVESTRQRLMLSDKIIRSRVREEIVDGRFVALSLSCGASKALLKASQTGMDVAQMNISQKRLQAVPIPVAPLSEQRRIMDRVAELMALCDELEDRLGRRERTQERLAEALTAVA